MRHPPFLCSFALVGALLGCSPPQSAFDRSASPQAARLSPAGDSGQDDLRVVCVRVAVVDLPVGAASEGEDIWARLQEQAIDAEQLKTLRANGLRAGVAPAHNLVDLVGVLEGLTGRELLYATVPAVSVSPRSLTLREGAPPRTVFTVRPDGSIGGVDYPGGEYVLMIAGRLTRNDPSRVVLSVVPQIRPPTAGTRMVRTGGRLSLQPYRNIVSLEEATVTAHMAVGDVLVIGPSGQSRRSGSIAHAFLAGDKGGVPFECVMLMIPEVITASPR